MRQDFKLITAEDLERHMIGILSEIGKDYEPEAVAAIARAGAGSERDMLSIAETCIAYSDKLTYEGVTAALGAADFKTAAKIVEAMLHGEMPVAISETEKLLAEGKAVGVTLRDLLELLSQIAVAKTCANAEKLLALPKELFARIKEIADGADGRAVLRATEILAKTENELRFASSPRILLETAIMRVSFPEADASMDALIVRMNEFERRLAQTPMPLGVPAFAGTETDRGEAHDDAWEAEIPPPEEPVYDAPFAEDPPLAREEPRTKREEKPVAEPVSVPAEKPATAEVAFGKFMRTLRKTSKNGVLFTMCSDLAAEYEGEKLVLTTEIETVCRSLNREDHRRIMAETFALVGIADFEVRFAQAEKQGTADAIAELKKNFSDYPVEVK